jgi:hypothetical protein
MPSRALTDLIVARSRWPTPPRVAVAVVADGCSCISITNVDFGRATPHSDGAAPDRPVNRALVLSDPEAHPRGRQGGRVPSMVRIVPTDLHRSMTHRHRAIKGRRREEKKTTTNVGSQWSPTPLGRHDTSAIAHLHRSTGLTPRTASTKDRHHAANLADPFPHRAWFATGTSFKRGRPFGLRDAARSEESVRQLVASSVRLPRRPIWQRPSARVMGLDD